MVRGMGYVGPLTLSLENLDNSTDVVLSRRLYNQFYFGLAHRHLPKTPDMLDVKDIDPLLRYALGETRQIAWPVRDDD